MAGNPAWVAGGVSPNPLGRTRGAIRWEDYDERMMQILDKYEYDQIVSFDDAIKKKKKVPLSSRDCIIIGHLAAIYRGDGKERERLLDRQWGKAVTRIGGENPGEPIKLASVQAIRLEVMDSEALEALAGVLRAAKEKQAQLAAQIDGVAQVVDNVVGNGDETAQE